MPKLRGTVVLASLSAVLLLVLWQSRCVWDGVYTLQVTENDPDGSQSTQSSGFVVPYSPEYRDLATNDALLASLASSTGGRAIQTADEAFAHDLPAVGAPRPIWPQLLAL